MLGVLGDLLEDIVVWLSEPLQLATDTDISMCRTRGGSAANVAMFAGPRTPTRFIGCVGADALGTALVAELAGYGVDVRVKRRGTTGTVIVLVDQRGERTMLPAQGAGALLDDVDPSWFDDLDHLHATTYSFMTQPVRDSAVAALTALRDRGATTSIDASSTGLLRRYGRAEFVELVEQLRPRFLFANRDEAAFLDLAAGTEAADLPHTVVVVKDGERPTTVFAPGESPLQVAVLPVAEVRDVTGAGDAFAAGFLTAYLDGADLRACCDQAHRIASTVLQTPGAALPT